MIKAIMLLDLFYAYSFGSWSFVLGFLVIKPLN